MEMFKRMLSVLKERTRIKKDYFEYCDAFIILTRQGVVLTSDDTQITFEEDKYLTGLNHRLMERRKMETVRRRGT